MVSSFSYSETKSLPSPIKNKHPRKPNHRHPILIPTNPSWGRLWPSTSRGTFLEPWSWQKQEPQRQVPAAQANPDGVPSYPGSLRASGIHLPTLGQWWIGGSGLTKAVLAVWQCKLPIWEILALTWLWRWRQCCQGNSLGMKTSLNMKMEEVTATHEACRLGRDASEERSSSLEEILSRLPWKYLFLKNAGHAAHWRGSKLSLLHKKKLRLWSLVTTLT